MADKLDEILDKEFKKIGVNVNNGIGKVIKDTYKFQAEEIEKAFESFGVSTGMSERVDIRLNWAMEIAKGGINEVILLLKSSDENEVRLAKVLLEFYRANEKRKRK